MTAFAVAYLLVTCAVGLYVVRLGTRQRRLESRLTTLVSQLPQEDGAPQQAPPRAA